MENKESNMFGFALFNKEFKHTFIQCKDKCETISIKTSNGKMITISIMYNACADIKYHNGKEDFETIGFHGGDTPIPSTAVTLQTIKLK
jgi:hypothetical protein